MSMDTTPSSTSDAISLACVPGTIPASERTAHYALITRLFSTQARERRASSGDAEGYDYRFDADAFDDLARWITNERRCCPFLTFAVELSPDDGPIWLRLAGPAGTRRFLDAELPQSA